ncbi:MAG: Crp/Fnr family transcriptional regulator [Betaproteobacteria bacterium]|nr:Crp/Fnr family transcriptional regulator [Betaproteobacteria bacterium]
MAVSRQILGQFDLIRSLPRDVLDELSARMQLREVARRAVVAAKDAPAAELGFLVTGRLQAVDFTVDGRSVGLYFVDPGDFYSELSVIDAQPAPEFVVAASNSTLAVLEAGAARELIFRFPQLSRQVMLRLAARLRAATAQRTLLGLPNPFQRLSVLILQLARQGPRGEHHATAAAASAPQTKAPMAIAKVPTHQELAIMINASRETVTRAFQVLFTHGVLLREGNELRVVNLRMLQDIADGRQDPPKA